MFSKQTKRSSVIGLDIGRVSIKAVQITPHDKGPRLDGVLSMQRDSEGAVLAAGEASRLARALDRRSMRASRVVLIAPTDALVGGSITVPPADSNVPRERIVEMELCRTHQLIPNTFELAWWDLPVPANGSRIGQAHAVALPHKAVDPALVRLGELGLETVRTVPTSLALLAAAQRRPIDPRRIAAVLDMGSKRAHLVLMYAGRVVHERPLPDLNIKSLRQDLASAMGVSDRVAQHAMQKFGLQDDPHGRAASSTTAILNDVIGALYEEIAMSFAYVSHLYPEAELGPLLLAGGGANVSGMATELSNLLELEAATLSPAELFGSGCFGAEMNDPAMAAALGAALCGEGMS